MSATKWMRLFPFLERELFKIFPLDNFFAASDAFSSQKMLISFIGVALIVALLKLYGFALSSFASSFIGQSYGGFIITLAPFFIIVSVYQIVASIVAWITFENVFYDTKTTAYSIMRFISKKAPSIFFVNIAFLIFINCVILLFCKIPLVGTAAFALIFSSIFPFSFYCHNDIYCLWFYPQSLLIEKGHL